MHFEYILSKHSIKINSFPTDSFLKKIRCPNKTFSHEIKKKTPAIKKNISFDKATGDSSSGKT